MTKRKNTIFIFTILVVIIAVLIIFSNVNVNIDTSGLDDSFNAKEKLFGQELKVLTLLPAILTVLLAFLTKEVITSLIAGVLSGYTILYIAEGGINGVFGGVLNIADSSVRGMVDVVADPYNASVIILCLCIGGLVGVIRISGSFTSLASKLMRKIKSPKGACLSAELMGTMIFFDDYANSLIVGPVMNPITDKLGVSREKLAYIVDSTAAPIAGIAIISSWISAELSAITAGFEIVGYAGSAYSMFLGSIPYCFYNIFCIAFIFMGSMSRRDYGKMLKAEVRARGGQPQNNVIQAPDDEKHKVVLNTKKNSIWIAILPIITLCLFALIGFYVDGTARAVEAGVIAKGAPFSIQNISTAFGMADTVTLILEASILASIVAIIMGVALKSFKFIEAIESWLEGAGSLFMTVVVLALAWTLSGVIGQLGTAYYLVEIITLNLPYWLVPTLIFISCCVISFAAGSYGCMLIVMPMTIPIAFGMAEVNGAIIGDTQAFIFACVAAVLSGSIFGDHCSPITDTTILSSVGAGCNNMDHVKTQLPYALTVALVSAVVGSLLSGLGVPNYITIPLGIIILLGVLFLFGKDATRISERGDYQSPMAKIIGKFNKKQKY